VTILSRFIFPSMHTMLWFSHFPFLFIIIKFLGYYWYPFPWSRESSSPRPWLVGHCNRVIYFWDQDEMRAWIISTNTTVFLLTLNGAARWYDICIFSFAFIMIPHFFLCAHDPFWLFLYSPMFIYSFICLNASLHSLVRHRYTLSLCARDIYLYNIIIPPPCPPCARSCFCTCFLHMTSMAISMHNIYLMPFIYVFVF
jgi:hypothetical protein